MPRATYLLTFTTCETPPLGGEAGARTRPSEPPLEFDEVMRNVVADCVVEVCGWNGWALHIANVLPTEVHILVSGERAPEYMRTELKAWATRRLRETGLAEPKRPVWTRNGSIGFVSSDEELARIVAEVCGAPGSDAVGLRLGAVGDQRTRSVRIGY